MKKSHCLLFLLALAASGWVFAASGQDASPDQQTPREQRRAELRSALHNQRLNDGHEAPRPLSPQERTILRQQLRQQQEQAGSRKP